MKKIIMGIVMALVLRVVAMPTVLKEGNMANTIYTQVDGIARFGIYIALVYVCVSIYRYVKNERKPILGFLFCVIELHILAVDTHPTSVNYLISFSGIKT